MGIEPMTFALRERRATTTPKRQLLAILNTKKNILMCVLKFSC